MCTLQESRGLYDRDGRRVAASFDGSHRGSRPGAFGIVSDAKLSGRAHLAEIFAGQSHKDCGTLRVEDVGDVASKARACALDAAATKKPFAITWDSRGKDSVMRNGVAGRSGDAGYELFWIDYDGCPFGCGDADPHSTTWACSELTNLRASCRRQKRAANPVTLEWVSDECRYPRPLELACGTQNEIAHCH